MTKGRTLKVFLVDGAPNGLLTAEIMNWTGHVITGPRTRLAELVQRPEIKRERRPSTLLFAVPRSTEIDRHGAR